MEIVFKRDPERADVDAVLAPLIAHADKAIGQPSAPRPIAFLIKDDSGAVVGGLSGRMLFDWLFVELLVVPEALRGSGIGKKLMQQAEDFARAEGLAGMWLDTFSFQARPFYEKLGFSVFGTLDNHPRGGQRYFLAKSFEPGGAV